MATRFEIVLPGTETTALRAAGEEALAEIERVEGWLSVYRPGTALATVNANAYRKPVPVSPPIFGLLQRAKELSRVTDNAFDPTIGPLVQAWRKVTDGRENDARTWKQTLVVARAAVGWKNVELEPVTGTVRFHHPKTQLDLGSLGKGWALDRAVVCLREVGISAAFLHGGTSSAWGLGHPPDADAWRVEIANVPDSFMDPTSPAPTRERVDLREASLSVSATWGRELKEPNGKSFGHVFDPRTGEPIPGLRRAAVLGPSAADTDALSTALLVAGTRLASNWQTDHPGLRFWL